MRSAAVVVGVGLLLVGTVLDRTGWWGWAREITDGALPVASLLVLVAAGLLATADAASARRAGAVGAVVAGAVTAVLLVRAVVDGLPGPAAGVLLVGVAAVVGGAVARAGRVSRGRHRVGSVAVGATVVAAAVVAGSVVDLPRGTTTDAPVTDAAVVTRPAAVRWSWSAGGPVADVVPVRGGVAVVRGTGGPRTDVPFDDDEDDGPGDEVVALDGTTGTPRWSFGHGRQRTDAVVPSPGGDTLVVSHVLPGRGALVTVLDAASGATRFTVVVPTRRGVLHLTDRVLTVLEPLPAPPSSSASRREPTTYRLVAHRLADGAQAWTWTPPPGCALEGRWSPTLGPPGRWTLATRDVGVTPVDCGPDRVLTGLDDRDGSVRWSVPGGPLVTPDGEVVTAEPDVTALPDGSGVLVGGNPARVVDAAGGASRPVPGLGRFDLGATRPGPVRALALSDGEPTGTFEARTGAIVPLPSEAPGECSTREGALAVTEATTLRLCGLGSGFGLRVDAGPVLPVDLGPPALVDDDSLREGLLYRRSAYVVVPAPGALVLTTTRTDPATVVGVG
ncbi:hypothetical protein [Actinomycetospora sp. CA-084318]|uniref:hypothetical protein n=1 Tax=Actinomycetospora sp. CA-084318 TaxID=3239892 RepID=UPI003D978C4D